MTLRRRAAGFGARHLVNPVGLGHRLEPVARARGAPRSRAGGIRGNGTDGRAGEPMQSRPLSSRLEPPAMRGRREASSALRTFPFRKRLSRCESLPGRESRVVRHSTGRIERVREPQGAKSQFAEIAKRMQSRVLPCRRLTTRNSCPNSAAKSSRMLTKRPAPGRGGAGLHIRRRLLGRRGLLGRAQGQELQAQEEDEEPKGHDAEPPRRTPGGVGQYTRPW